MEDNSSPRYLLNSIIKIIKLQYIKINIIKLHKKKVDIIS